MPGRSLAPFTRFSALLFALILALALSACTFAVQPVHVYTSPDGHLSFDMPESWEVLSEDDWGSTSVLVGSADDLLYQDVTDVPPGEAVVQVTLMPSYWPDSDGEVAPMTAHEYIDFALRDARVRFPDSETQSITLADGSEAYSSSLLMESHEVEVVAFEVADEILVSIVRMAAANERNEMLLAEIDGIVNSIKFQGEPAEFVQKYLEVDESDG